MIELHPYLRPLAFVMPLLVAAGLWAFLRRRRRVREAFRGSGLARELAAFSRLRPLLVIVAAGALAAALYDPAWRADRGAGSGGAVVLILDVSNSMLTQDVRPDRLALERAAARRLARSLDGTPVGIVVFAGRAYALSPPTVDPAALDLYLDALDPSMVTQSGSALGAAVRQGVGLLASTRERTGTLVLISDGDAMEAPEEEQQGLALARRTGIPVHTLGIGTAAGGPVPDVDLRTGRRTGYKREPDGSVAVSRLGEARLRRIADASGGGYSALASPGGVDALAGRLRADPSAGSGAAGEDTGYGWLAGAALLLLAVEMLLPRLAARRAAA